MSEDAGVEEQLNALPGFIRQLYWCLQYCESKCREVASWNTPGDRILLRDDLEFIRMFYSCQPVGSAKCIEDVESAELAGRGTKL